MSETEIPSCYCRDEVFEEKSCLYEPHTEYFAGLTSPAHRSGLCMWWDERCPSNPDDTRAEQEATHVSCTRLLQAFVDLDCPYVRCVHARHQYPPRRLNVGYFSPAMSPTRQRVT